jgi:predicted DNA binding CopG/RHH family protein
MDSETILLKTEYATNKSYTIKLEQDIFDLETSLKIQKQKNKINSQEGSLNGTHPNEQYENIKTLLLEQRFKTMEHEVLKQDSKMNLLSDKVMDMKMEFTLRGNQYRRQARQIVQINMKMRKKNKQTILIYLLVHQLATISLNQIIIVELMKSQ